MKANKNTKPSTTIKQRPKIVAFFDYMDMLSFKQKPMCLDGLERIGAQLIEYVLKEEAATSLKYFFQRKGVSGETLIRWRKRSKKLDKAIKFAREVIAERRDHGSLTKKFDSAYGAKSMAIYDTEWRELEEWRSGLRTIEQEQKATTFNITVPSFSDKKGKADDKGKKDTSGS